MQQESPWRPVNGIPEVTNAWLLCAHDEVGASPGTAAPDGVIRTSSGPCSSCYRVWRERAAPRLSQRSQPRGTVYRGAFAL